MTQLEPNPLRTRGNHQNRTIELPRAFGSVFHRGDPAQERSPFVKENFHWAPYGHSTGDDQAFSKNDR
jgi:hypothetical protein